MTKQMHTVGGESLRNQGICAQIKNDRKVVILWLWSLHTNLHNASAKAVSSSLVWCSEKGHFITTMAPSDREWHVHFMSGLHSHIGAQRKCDAAFSIEQMIAIQGCLECEWHDSNKEQDILAQWWIAGKQPAFS
jgi:hypothetical protein